MVLPKGLYSLDGLYNWSLKQAHENQHPSWQSMYIWTPPAKTLLKILEEKGNHLVFLTGEQGQGKTATLLEIWERLNGCVFTTWRNYKSIKKIKAEERTKKIRTILIALPDYGFKSKSRISKSLDQIQTFWDDINYMKNIVITLQKEQPVDYFFLGKGIHIHLEPLPLDEIVEAVRQFNPQYQKHALFAFYRLAELSGGTFVGTKNT